MSQYLLEVGLYGAFLSIPLTHIDNKILPKPSNKILYVFRGITLFVIFPFILVVMVGLFVANFNEPLGMALNNRGAVSLWIVWIVCAINS